jgi:hypothetical protein
MHQLEEVSSVVVPGVNGIDVDAGDGDVRYLYLLLNKSDILLMIIITIV